MSYFQLQMAQENEETDFNITDGDRISFRLTEELGAKLDKALAKFPGIYESRSHFVRCAISRELRRLESAKPGMEFNESGK